MKQQLPDFFVKKIEQQYGNKLCEKIKESFEKTRFTTFRVNTLKSNNEEIEKALKDNSIEFEKASISDNAYIVKNANEAKIQELEAFKEGKIYLQSLSSMLPPIILEPKENSDILDMAAAPGGKTTQMAAISNNKSHITACERNAIRAEKLKYNIEKQGASCVFCMVKDSREIDDFFSFDQILLDAPCSGSGTLDLQNEKLNKYFTETLIEKSVKTQKQLLNKAIKILKKGSEMVYSTCSILQEENEEVIQSFLKTGKVEIVPIEIEKLGNLPVLPTSIKGTLCLMPNEYFEGFFVAKLKKKE